MAKNRRRLKQIWINPEFQKHFLVKFGFLNLISCGLFVATILSFLVNVREMAEESGFFQSAAFQGFWDVQVQIISFSLLIAVLVSFFLFLYLGLTMSHKIAGPLYRLNNHFKKLAKSEEDEEHFLEKVTFRKGDYFREIEDSFNDLVDKQNSSHE
ncbi:MULTISPECIES: hypothetical protein [Halobacteriovorax]|uniref:HAMP domain-containing protein n=1 Tax=Halobacteriovorax vibrionivorans TaxID=2152716 RepID=A0ABY0IGA0_9BACT|nr:MULTISPECIES: hypothetical protein [Halobacteriovorax]RZF21138.1 hypothetical protein DAY19_14255 [Halobacteriovorax vibrionivorans]TGD46265.1 hypothetical protein EP118_12760 [Halobacteriovorax sp. Y22]